VWGKLYDWKGWKLLVAVAVFLGPISYFVSTLNYLGILSSPLFSLSLLSSLTLANDCYESFPLALSHLLFPFFIPQFIL
jgi:hypothetical protein